MQSLSIKGSKQVLIFLFFLQETTCLCQKKKDSEQLFRFNSLVPLIERDYIIILFINLLKFFLGNKIKEHELVSLIINE